MKDEKPISPVVAGWLIFMALVQLLFLTAKLWNQFQGSWYATWWPLDAVLIVCVISILFARKPPAE